MTIKLIRFTNILLLILGMFIAPQALAQAVKVDSADPSSAPQGTLNQMVTIKGSGFNNSAKVHFYKTATEDPGGITVRSSKTLDPETIEVIIDIADTLEAVAEYDIEVRLGGRRGGKGTTAKLFSVTPKNQETVSCFDAFGVANDMCDCRFNANTEGGQGTPSVVLWALQGDCSTKDTLQLLQYEALNGNGHTVTAVAPFVGSSVIANSGHRAHVFSLNIAVAGGVTTGCATDGSNLNSAISFVLDDSKVSPEDIGDADGRIYPLTRLRAWGINVDSANPLCRAIEFRRDPSYDDMLGGAGLEPSDYTDAMAHIQDVLITSGSYSEAGIQVSGFVNAEVGGRSDDKIGIHSSSVMGATGTGGSAILFGPVYGPGTVAQNAVTANGEIGIVVEGGDGIDDVIIENNNVVGAGTAIWVDDQVEDAFFKSNVLMGDGLGGIIDTGIDTSACNNRYRSNRINEFDIDVQESLCSLP